MTHRKLILTEADHNSLITLAGAQPDLVALLKGAKEFQPSTEAQREKASGLYCLGSDDNIEIDDDAGISESDIGYWVEAWVFVHEED